MTKYCGGCDVYFYFFDPVTGSVEDAPIPSPHLCDRHAHLVSGANNDIWMNFFTRTYILYYSGTYNNWTIVIPTPFQIVVDMVWDSQNNWLLVYFENLSSPEESYSYGWNKYLVSDVYPPRQVSLNPGPLAALGVVSGTAILENQDGGYGLWFLNALDPSDFRGI